jgi:hypothetical protein
MATAALLEQLMSARQQLDSAHDLLTKPSPETLDRCSSVLEAAGHQLAEWQPTFSQRAGNAAALEEAWRLRRSFVRTTRLLQGAGDFHLNWLRLRGAMTGGYTETGESAPLLHRNRISLHG